MNNEYESTIESFISFCDEMKIVEEGLFSNKSNNSINISAETGLSSIVNAILFNLPNSSEVIQVVASFGLCFATTFSKVS